ncbi:MAG: histidine--tRNA ligase [Candidatus Colwellbacteria bacterium]|nr:histidine--tRNA ligase [Candidatus Colwellbacteria bacterium]
MKKINLDLPSGFRDYLPSEAAARLKMVATVRQVFERFGFQPLDTPSVERIDVLASEKSDVQKQIFRLKDKENLGLRFDLTVPLARAVVSYPELGRPFKRYQVGNVFRGEKAQAGRYREFLQMDADIIGSDSVLADAEIISLMYQTLRALGVGKFTIKIGHRAVLERVLQNAGVPKQKILAVIRAIDKVEKVGWGGEAKKYKSEIENFDYKGAPEFLDLRTHLMALGVPEKNYKFDISVARGLDYYTGMVCETVLDDLPEIGSIFSGGRYNGLVSRFSKMEVPAVGASVGVDRLFVALQKLGILKGERVGANVLVLNFEPTASEVIQKVATDLRRAEISTEIYLGKEATLKGQLAYAVSHEYPVVVIIGAEELKGNAVTVRDMRARGQTEVGVDKVVAAVKEVLQ